MKKVSRGLTFFYVAGELETDLCRRPDGRGELLLFRVVVIELDRLEVQGNAKRELAAAVADAAGDAQVDGPEDVVADAKRLRGIRQDMLIFCGDISVIQAIGILAPSVEIVRVGEEGIAQFGADEGRPFLLGKEIITGIEIRAEGMVLSGFDIEVRIPAGQIRPSEIVDIIDAETDRKMGIELIPSEQVETIRVGLSLLEAEAQ